MIRHITFCINHASKIRKLGLSNANLHFEPGYNVLIGPNGAGKSTVLKALATCDACKIDRDETDRVKYITTETLNPLVGGSFDTREEMIRGIRAMFHSHGKGVLDSIRNRRHDNESVVLIDSPETGQDHENSEFIYQGLLKMAEHYQVIIATNSLVFMRNAHLIDLGEAHLQWLLQETRDLLTDFESS